MSRRNLNRRQFLRTAAISAVAGGAALYWPRAAAQAAPTGSPSGRRPNILFIIADDHRHDAIAALGNSVISTPNLDKLVRGGFAFRQARCMGAQQGGVCMPARAMLHAGRTLYRTPTDLPPQYPIMPEILRQAGYNTFGCGKWHNGGPSFARGFGAGGNIMFGGMTHDQYKVAVHDFDPSGNYGKKGAHVASKFSSELFADAAVEFLHKQSGEKPFFCYCAFTSPHDPRTPPPPFSTMYDPAKMPLPANFLPQHPFDNGELKIRDELLAPFPRTADNTRKQLCDYYGMISSQDAQVGRMLDALRQTGQYDNTIIVYTGDHGLAIGSHGLFGKQNLYEHSACVPLLMAGPGVPQAKTSDALVYGFDIFPTLCDLTGLKIPGTVEGKSLARVLTGAEAKVRDSSFHGYTPEPGMQKIGRGDPGNIQRAVRDERWKLIRYRINGKVTNQLFDLQNDPEEIKDLSRDATAAGQLPRLEALLKQWQRDLGDDEKPRATGKGDE